MRKIWHHELHSFRNAYLVSLIIIQICFSMALQAQNRPNVIFILTDQWRSTAFGFAGDTQVKTPYIDQFSKESVVFKNCVSVMPICTPYRAALMTGRFPTSTGMFMNDLYMPEKELCMAEIFKKQGYATAFYGKWHLDGHGRLNNVQPFRRQGFDYWKGIECTHDYNKMPYFENNDLKVKYWDKYSAFAIVDDAAIYLEQASKSANPFLLFLSIESPHFSQHTAPQHYQDMYPKEKLVLSPNVIDNKFPNIRENLKQYYAHCTATDKAIGDLINKIKSLGLYDNSIIILTADHGEMMGSHGVRPHEKQISWDESVKTPFLIRYPGIGNNAGKLTQTPITTPDVLPTMLSLAGLSIPQTIEGRNISSVIKNPTGVNNRAALYMNVYPTAPTPFSEYRAIKTNRYTYVKTPDKPLMLFDHVADSLELNNLIDNSNYARVKKKMDRLMHKELKAIGDENFKPSEYYLNKFGLTEMGIKRGDIINTSGNLGKVYTPKSD